MRPGGMRERLWHDDGVVRRSRAAANKSAAAKSAAEKSAAEESGGSRGPLDAPCVQPIHLCSDDDTDIDTAAILTLAKEHVVFCRIYKGDIYARHISGVEDLSSRHMCKTYHQDI